MKHLLYFLSLVLLLMVSDSYFVVWFLLELNLFVFLFLVSDSLFKSSGEVLMKYFLMQSLFSLFLLGVTLLYFDWILVSFILWLKLMLMPFAFWFVNSLKFLDKMVFFYLMTFQKLPGFFLMEESIVLSMFIILNVIVGLFYMIYYLSMLGFIMGSTFIHSGWILVGSYVSFGVVFVYYLNYMVLFYLLVREVSSIESFWSVSENSYMMMVLMLIFMGFPPFIMFFMKLLILFIVSANVFMVLFLLVTTILSFFFYFRVFIIFLMGQYSKMYNSFVSSGVFLLMSLSYLELLFVF